MTWLRKLLQRVGLYRPSFTVLSQVEHVREIEFGRICIVECFADRYDEAATPAQAIAMHRSDHPGRTITGIFQTR